MNVMDIFRNIFKAVPILLLFQFSGCAALDPADRLEIYTPDRFKSDVKFYDRGILQLEGVTILEFVQAASCKDIAEDPLASQTDALFQLQDKTRSLGGNGIGNVTCTEPKKINDDPACESKVTCYGTAIDVKSKRLQDKDGELAESRGSGFFLGKLPMIITNYHVIEGAYKVEIILTDGRKIEGRVTRRDKKNDLAVISFDEFRESPKGLFLFPSLKLKTGQDVYAIGYPLGSILGDRPGITRGIISATVGIEGDSRHLRITAQINPGNSGGPLLDSYGRVVGIVSHGLNKILFARFHGIIPEGTNFAIKSDVLLNLIDTPENLIADKQAGEKLTAASIFALNSDAVIVVKVMVKVKNDDKR